MLNDTHSSRQKHMSKKMKVEVSKKFLIGFDDFVC